MLQSSALPVIGIPTSWNGKLPFSRMSQISEAYDEHGSCGVQKNMGEVNSYNTCCYGIDQRIANRKSPLTVQVSARA